MNYSQLTNYEISVAVDKALKVKNLSVRRCCEIFNKSTNFIDSDSLEKIILDKDLVQRVRHNKFSVVNTRVSKLCDFLGIDLKASSPSLDSSLIKEFQALEVVIRKNPNLESKLRVLLNNVIEVLAANGVNT